MKKADVHYGWIVLAMGTIGVFSALGLARFGYTTVLPAMQENLGMDNGQTGLLASLNLLGYLSFSIIGGALATRYGARLIAALGLVLAGISMILTGLSYEFDSLAVWRAMTGIGSGAANVAIMGLWSSWFSTGRRGLASGIAVSGSSVALILTGLFVPWVLQAYGQIAWHKCWFIYGIITLFIAAGSYLFLRNHASEKGLGLIGEENSTQTVQISQKEKPQWKQVYMSIQVWQLGFIYIAFGFSYIIYMTFFVKYLVADHSYSGAEAGRLFMLMGWFSLLCGLIWGMLSDRIGRKNTLIIIYLLHTIAYILFAAGKSPIYLIVSAILFGISAWSIPALMAAICGDMLGRKMAPAALGFITLFFGTGQAAGPIIAGNLADVYGSFSPAFILAAAVALLGAAGSALFIKKQ